MHIGLDLDNTLICYDGVFHRIAVEDGFVPASTATDKTSVRDTMHAAGLRDEWTELQGRVYGSRLHEAKLFAGAKEVLNRWKADGHRLTIISHKTQFPFLGEKVDLHESARRWIASQELNVDAVFFRQTIEEKVAEAAAQGCEAFVDDLPNVLELVRCPVRIWFDAGGERKADCPDGARHAGNWQEVESWIS